MRNLLDRLPRPTRFTQRLLLFALVNSVLINVVLKATQGWRQLDGPREDPARQQFTLYHTAKFLLFQTTQGDSWEPMTVAWTFLKSGASGSVYDYVWQQQLKFLYPPSGLFPIDVVHTLFPGDSIRWEPLNLVSWLAVWGTAVLVALIFRDSCREHLAPSMLAGASRADDAARMAIAVALTLTFYPIVRAFTLGQIQPWVDVLFAAMVWLTMKRNWAAAGVMAGLICLIKPHLALLLIWAALRNKWRFATGLVAVAGAGALAGAAVYGLQASLDYLSWLSYLTRHGEAYYSNQSVNGLLNRLLQNGDNAGISEPLYPPFRWPVYLGTLFSSAALLGVGLLWRRDEHASEPVFDLMIATLAITMASPIAWSHHYGILMPIYAALLPAMVRRPVFGAASTAYLAVAYALSSNLFYITRSLADTPFTIVQSYLFFAAVLVLFALCMVRHAIARDDAGEQPVAKEPLASARPEPA